MLSAFAAELELAHKEGVVRQENLPFLLQPEIPNQRALLLVHGFSASPHEMRPLGEFLCRQGYTISGVRLSGHGTSPENLQPCRWQDWLQSISRNYAILQKSTQPIGLVGQSTGALLGIALAQQKRLTHLALLSPFLHLRHPLARFAGFIKYFLPFQERKLPHPQDRYYYERRPLAGVEQIVQLSRSIKPQLPEIKTPTLVLSAAGDQTVAQGTGQQLFDRLGSAHKEFYLFGPEVPHVLSTEENPRFNQVCERLKSFLNGNKAVIPDSR